jgi:hypothetical protein
LGLLNQQPISAKEKQEKPSSITAAASAAATAAAAAAAAAETDSRLRERRNPLYEYTLSYHITPTLRKI